MPTPLRIGLTGGIACGKSHVLSRLAKAGFHPLDLDRVAHEVMAPGGAAYEDVVAAFGPGILGPAGAIDRQALGAVVFRDEDARQRLNAIVHPRVWAEEARYVARWSGEAGSVVVTDAALLVESGLHLRFDRLVVVHCPPEVQLRRLDGPRRHRRGRGLVAPSRPDADPREAALWSFRGDHCRLAGRDLGRGRCAGPGDPGLGATCVASAWLSVAIARSGACTTVRTAGRGACRRPALLSEIAQRGGIAMEGLKSLLSPPAPGVWYRAARADEGGPGPATLAGALVLWQSSRGVADEERLLAAMASVARLTHDAAPAIGNACVLALAMLQEIAAAPSAMIPLADRLALWRSKAERWAGGSFPDELRPVLSAVEEHPGDVGRARAVAASGGGSSDLAGALAGLRGGSGPDPLRPDAERAVDALLRVSDHPATG